VQQRKTAENGNLSKNMTQRKLKEDDMDEQPILKQNTGCFLHIADRSNYWSPNNKNKSN